ncbi:MAG TPA: carbohydrate kinase family protein [Candidatus Saccharimonadales bacterium]|nr:carbohydrate kinase family protein [Candidatus Saccharimonadales bacterium]
MPSLPRPSRGRRPSSRATVIVLGDLMLDVVLAPARPLESGSDVPGRVVFVQGGSAATTARWLARLGARSSLIGAVGRDAAGRALVEAVRGDGVVAHVSRVAGARTGRIGVLVAPDGERSFVADRGAADGLGADDLRASWFATSDALHLPVYSLLGEPLGLAGRRAVALARDAGAMISVDLASIVPLLSRGRRAARTLIDEIAPDLLFATAAEAEALLGRYRPEGLLDLAPMAVIKRGSKGATVLAREGDEVLRFEVATEHIVATDTTGAGDAFDAGFLVGWFAARSAGRSLPASLQRAALAGHRAAAKQLTTTRPEITTV